LKHFKVDQDGLRDLVREPGVARQLEGAGAKVKSCEIELTAEIGDEVRFNVKEVLVNTSSIQYTSRLEIILWYPKRFRVSRPDVNEEFRQRMERMGYEVRGAYPILDSHGLRLLRKTTGSTEALIEQALQDLPVLRVAQAQLVQYFDAEVAHDRNARRSSGV